MDTIISIARVHSKSHPDRTILKYKEGGIFQDVAWRALWERVTLLSCAMLDLGVKMGERVAILSENRPEWVYVDLASLACGAVSVPIYATSSARDIEYILKDSGAVMIFVSTKDKLEKVISAARDTDVRRIVSFESFKSLDPLVTVFDNFLSRGRERLPVYSATLEDRIAMARPESLVTIIYTSGSTGRPKGVELTNKNFVSNCRASAKMIGITDRDRYLSFLPLSHVFERMAGYYMFLIQCGEIVYAESRETITRDAKAMSPTLICGVPRFYEKLYAEITNRAIRGSPIKRNLFFWGYRIGRACMFRRLRGRKVPLYLSIQRRLATAPISSKLRKTFGGRVRFFVSGGAPLSKEVAYFFLSFDILVLEGYGLTESSPVITVNTPKRYKIGTVGRPIPGVEVRIAHDGEIMARGPNIMRGYFRLYKDSECAVKDGWLYTGDIGRIDKDGYLVITDRKKDIIVTSGGKNVAPSEIETIIKADRYIDDILIYGDKKKYLSALVIPDFEALKKYAAFKRIAHRDTAGLVKDGSVISFFKRRIDEKQKELPGFAQVKRFVILDKGLSQDEGELTPTLKIKRLLVTKKYKKILDGLYEEGA